tara:strand:- start:61 stop:1470 length:1410 start_codon:yes stop_codon:yes gene_type:complete
MKSIGRKKILVLIDDDVMVRHFIANNTFDEIERSNEVLYVFNQDNERYDFKSNEIVKNKINKDKIRYTYIPRKRVGHWFLLYIIHIFRQLRMNIKNKNGAGHFKAVQDFQTRAIGKRNIRLAKIAGLPIIYQIINFIFRLRLGIHQDVIKLLDTEKPDLIIHPSFLKGYYVNEIFAAAPKYKIPLIILVNSWDNCSSKAFCTGKPDKLVVWGKQGKIHAKQYLNMSEDKIECFGAAQFEIYKTPPKENKEELARFFNVDPQKKILLFAGVSSSDNDTLFLKLLEKGIEESLLPNCHVIYRPHPWRGTLKGDEEDFFKLKWNHITMDPTMVNFYRTVIYKSTDKMFLADYSISNKLMTLVDGVISPLSTMLVEALIKGKPVLAFFPKSLPDQPLRLQFIHYKEFIELKETNSCFNEDDFIKSCKKLFNQIGDESIAKKLRKKSEFFVSNKKKSYGYQLEKLTQELLKNKN